MNKFLNTGNRKLLFTFVAAGSVAVFAEHYFKPQLKRGFKV